MDDKSFEASKLIYNNLLPRLRFLRESFAAIVEKEIQEHDTSIYEGAVLTLDDIITAATEVMDFLEG